MVAENTLALPESLRWDTMPPPSDRNSEQERLPNAWLFDRLNRLEDAMRDQHQRLRSDMGAGFDLVRNEINHHEDFAMETRRRIDMVMTERRVEKDEVKRRSTLYGLLAGALVPAVVEAIKKIFGH